MPVVQLNAVQPNRQQRRARMGKTHAFGMPRAPADASISDEAPYRRVMQPEAEQAVLLDLFGRPPVVFHRSFVEIAGGVSGALWLSHAVALSQEPGAEGKATFYFSSDQCAEATGMSRREQELARKSLRTAGLLVECRQGGAPTYRLDFERLASLLLEQSAAAWSLPRGRADAPATKALHATAA